MYILCVCVCVWCPSLSLRRIYILYLSRRCSISFTLSLLSHFSSFFLFYFPVLERQPTPKGAAAVARIIQRLRRDAWEKSLSLNFAAVRENFHFFYFISPRTTNYIRRHIFTYLSKSICTSGDPSRTYIPTNNKDIFINFLRSAPPPFWQNFYIFPLSRRRIYTRNMKSRLWRRRRRGRSWKFNAHLLRFMPIAPDDESRGEWLLKLAHIASSLGEKQIIYTYAKSREKRNHKFLWTIEYTFIRYIVGGGGILMKRYWMYFLTKQKKTFQWDLDERETRVFACRKFLITTIGEHCAPRAWEIQLVNFPKERVVYIHSIHERRERRNDKEKHERCMAKQT